METVSPTLPDDSSSANPSSVKSDDSSPRHEGGRGSPPPNCAICLGTCKNKSFTDSCLHQFCFKCLLTWSKVKAVCPLCKQNFKSIIHNVRSNHQYEEYMVEQRETEETIERLDNDSSITPTRRFRYRTTLTLPRQESITIQELLTQYPLSAELFPPPAPAPRRRPSPASFRRTVYRHRLWARPLPDFTGRFRDCTPEFYRYNDTQMHRLVPWLNRELNYLLNENVGHISYVITRILELLPRYHIASQEFREAVQVYLRDRTEHFLHELYCFASTPYDMTGYDRYVQYTTRISTMVNEVISSSESEGSVDSDIVMVSSSEPAEPPAGPSRVSSFSRLPGPSRIQGSSRLTGSSRVPEPVYPQNYISEPTSNNNVITIETISQSDTDDDSSEVMVVGYIKPPQDRTPEVVDLLGSDSDVIVQDTVPEPTPDANETQENRPLVKFTLKRHVPNDDGDSDSGESTSRPPPAARRRRRQRSNDSTTTSDTYRSTPSPASEWQPMSDSLASLSTCPSLMSPSTDATSTSDTYSDSSSTSSSNTRRTKMLKRKTKRKSNKESLTTVKEKKRSRTKRTSRTHRKDKQSVRLEKDKSRKRKSHSSKTIKPLKKNEATSTADLMPVNIDQPSTSGVSSNHKDRSKRERKRRPPSSESKRRPASCESKRLKSVVNIMCNKNNGESSSSGTCNVLNSALTNSNASNTLPENSLTQAETSATTTMKDNEDSDSEDNLPLNLTIQKLLQ
ncbi:E3 ubiquitin-protein ligase Topors-like [Achroia grisella]|uniref:E3 ubiquitin-protein ligase Topors-like n=1 Tax=Achroia grisella TaxID=688607 RepID=UPI0027D31E8B|nr:E3 ubiquitin-protein ligase Topors-like [Achroia grisella]